MDGQGNGSGKRGLSRGSLTVYMSLVLAVMVTLIGGLILSAKVYAGRAQAAESADQALFSLFARYDRQLMEKYGLFFLYAGDGGPDIAACTEEVEREMRYTLEPNLGHAIFGSRNLLTLRTESCAASGYTLATDAGGAVFQAQAAEAVRDTGVLQALLEAERRRGQGEEAGKDLTKQSDGTAYSDLRRRSREAEAARAEEDPGKEDAGTEVPEGFENPLPFLEQLKKLSPFEQVLPPGRNVSDRGVSSGNLVSHRKCSKGMGIIRIPDAGVGDDLLFRAYIWTHYGCFTDPSEESALSCQIEYILQGKMSDRANMKGIVTKLLLAREGANLLFLYTNPEMSRRLSGISLLIGSAMMIPEAAPAIRLLLAAGWAYAESLVDVRALLSGKRIASVKTAGTWQTDVESLARNGADLDALAKDCEDGLDYRDYLGIFLLAAGKSALAGRTMDMTELQIRGSGRENFRLDSCLDALTVETRVRSENLVTFPVVKTICYREM